VQDNILISDQDHAQITDFGIARILNAKGFTNMTERNARFSAPELMPIDESKPDVRPTRESDIFSLGMLLLQVCSCIHVLFDRSISADVSV
jgi:serine/threonine protein kinase